VTKLMSVITRVRMLRFTRQDKDTLQRRLMIVTLTQSFFSKFIRIHVLLCTSNIQIKGDLTKLLQK